MAEHGMEPYLIGWGGLHDVGGVLGLIFAFKGGGRIVLLWW